MQKKGAIEIEMLVVLFDVLILVVLSLALFGDLNDFQQDITFEKRYLVRDIAAVLTTVQAFAGDVQLEYPLPRPFAAELKENEIILASNEASIAYPFPKVMATVPVTLRGAAKIIISKKSQKVTIS